MGFLVNSDGTLDLSSRATLRHYRHCSYCDSAGEMVQRAGGYAVVCPNPACAAPLRPFGEVCPTREAAAGHWRYLNGGSK